jgi:hypothetical protein
MPIVQLGQHDFHLVNRQTKDVPRLAIVTDHYGAHVRVPPFTVRIGVLAP